jgi:signal peptidase II
MQNKKLILITFILVFIDQLSKNLINLYMYVGQNISIIPNFFALNYVRNVGAAFSMLQGARWFFIILSILVLNIIYIYLISNKILSNKKIILYSMLISGIIGNLIDRLLYGYVIDFLSFNIFGYDFAIFNIADTFIVISIILLIIMGDKDAIFSRKRK